MRSHDLYYSAMFISCFLLCCLWLWIVFYAVSLKKHRCAVISAAGCGICFFLLQISEYRRGRQDVCLKAVFHLAACLPVFLWYILFAVLAAAALIMIRYVLRWRKNHITPMSIRDCGDGHPAGIVFWKEKGRVLYSNKTADRISDALTGMPVLNGREFFESLEQSPIGLPDGSLWDYHHRLLNVDGEMIHELTAVDVTDLTHRMEELREDTRRIRRMNKELWEYSCGIEELVRRRETLNARIRIHDEMNHLLMAAERAFEDTGEIPEKGEPDEASASEGADRSSAREKQQEILRSWKKNAVLLFREQENERQNHVLEDLITYGALQGIEFCWDHFPESADREMMRLLVLVSREAMNNAVKHGAARKMHVSSETDGHCLTVVFTNDGRRPEQPVAFTGGLLQMRKETEKAGGTIRAEISPEFRLVITIPEGDRKI